MNRKVVWVAITCLFVWIVLVFVNGWAEARVFSGSPVDGPFQLLNALRRLHAGQRAGTDFPFFHGVGVPWLHYPMFALLGANLWASELARQWLSPFLYLVSTAVFAWVATSGSPGKTVVFVALCALLSSPLGLAELYAPGNSLLGVRSTMPVFFFALLLSRLSMPLKIGIGGVLVALSWICGTDQGLMLMAACALAGACLLIQRNPDGRPILGSLAIGLVALAPLLALVSGLNVGPVLRYAFVDLPEDQFWFFGAPPNGFPSGLWSLHLIGARAILIIAIAGAMWCQLLWSSRKTYRRESSILFLMLTAGLLSCSSYLALLSAHYFAPLGRLLLLGILARVVSQASYAWLVVLAVPAVLLGLAGPASDLWKRRGKLFESGPTISGCILSSDWSQHLSQIEASLGPLAGQGNSLPLWSTYRGLPEAVAGAVLPGEDYLIHALGSKRRADYLARFRRSKPEFVLTNRADRMNYEEWLRNSAWPFYKEILDHYDIAAQTPFSLLWRRRAQPADAGTDSTAIPVADNSFQLPSGTNGIEVMTINLEYKTSSTFEGVPVVKLLPRYLINLNGTINVTPVSLPPAPKGGRFEFGVLCQPGVTARLQAEAKSLLPSAHVTIGAVQIQSTRLRPEQALFAAAGQK